MGAKKYVGFPWVWSRQSLAEPADESAVVPFVCHIYRHYIQTIGSRLQRGAITRHSNDSLSIVSSESRKFIYKSLQHEPYYGRIRLPVM